MKSHVLIIDDDPIFAASMARLIKVEDYIVDVAHSGEEALERIPDILPDLALIDMSLPGINGIEVLNQIRQRAPMVVSIMVSAYSAVDQVVAAIQAGAFDYITKTSNPEEIRFRVCKALEMAALQEKVSYLEGREREEGRFQMVGKSLPIQKVFSQIKEISASPDTTVLILGETGTGKELVARAIHDQSAREARLLVPVNCTAIPANLMESEFFGHERGAFTGAERMKKGLVEQASGGTLFLDEIGDLSMDLQGKLLRVIEQRSFNRVGGVKELEVDVRFIAATNKDLSKLVAVDRFREDLLYRLNVFVIQIPPLRQRDHDIILLANHFIKQLNPQLNKDIHFMAPEVESALLEYPFPGNVRELRNMIEQTMILTRGKVLILDLFRSLKQPQRTFFPAEPPQPPRAPQMEAGGRELRSPWHGKTSEIRGTPAERLTEVRRQEGALWRKEKQIIQQALDQVGGNKSQAAKLLGISRYALLRRLRRMDS